MILLYSNFKEDTQNCGLYLHCGGYQMSSCDKSSECALESEMCRISSDNGT